MLPPLGAAARKGLGLDFPFSHEEEDLTHNPLRVERGGQSAAAI